MRPIRIGIILLGDGIESERRYKPEYAVPEFRKLAGALQG